ncbi:hypothetical protein BZA05DRAFT_339212 [Tricharina praecox]|uniref:uncharacterized protein n=1 Tax=Tricharina praecox TaxID=43433 RepID=UPI00221F66BE|nr:uncharacterized protein BZA05DRAFT_339212 [Tricharina praecox]KAI5849716.1 hypothetical protein BZA05DRAFT_339212 [Tricharina praecox]
MPFIQRGPTHDIPFIEIRLDEDVVVFRGLAEESNGAMLKGLVALCIRDSVAIRGISLVLQGVRRLHWSERQPPPVAGLMSNPSRTIKHEEVFYEKKWNFLESNGHTNFTVMPGNYEYPFQLPLAGELPESVEGLGSTHVVYRLKARISRGKFSHDITAKKHLRIIRTLGPNSLELTQTMSVENLWPEKVQYSISIPSKAVVFGTCIPVDIVLVPLLKGLTIGKVVCALKEIHTLTCAPKTSQKVDTRHIVTQTFDSGAMEEDSEEELGKWVMHDRIVLPKSLNACVQDCEVPSIKIRHKLKFTIQLHNPDGHMSELRASLPVMLFISPNYLMDDTNRIPSDAPETSTDTLANAPPRYDEHYLDRLYENVRHDSFDTPLPSGANTPMPLSRNPSSDNLGSLVGGHVEPIRLPDASSRRWTVGSSASDRGPPSDADTSTPQSRTPTPPLLAPPAMEDLSRVPSYTTAVRTGTRNLCTESTLPLYDQCDATPHAMSVRSAPASPQNSPPGMGHMFSSRPRMMARNTTGDLSSTSAGGIQRRSHSSHHLHSLGNLLEGLRG